MALRRCCGAGLLRRGALHGSAAPDAPSAAPKAAARATLPLRTTAEAASWDKTRKLAERADQRRAAYLNAPGSGAGAPPPEVSPEELRTWERRLGGTAHAFPDWIEAWSRGTFYKVGAGLAAAAGATALAFGPLSTPALAVAAPAAAFWAIGMRDINQTRHTVWRVARGAFRAATQRAVRSAAHKDTGAHEQGSPR
jgi:hypothetical protein